MEETMDEKLVRVFDEDKDPKCTCCGDVMRYDSNSNLLDETENMLRICLSCGFFVQLSRGLMDEDGLKRYKEVLNEE